MPAFQVKRTYVARLGRRRSEWEASELHAGRCEILERAIEGFNPKDLTVEWGLDGDSFMVSVTKKVRVERFDQITARFIADTADGLLSGLDALAERLGEAADELASDDEVSSWESLYGDTGFEPQFMHGDAQSVLGSGSTTPQAAEVCIDVDRRVAAVASDPERLRSMVWSAVLDERDLYGRHLPTELKCDVDLVCAKSIRFSGAPIDVDEAVQAVLSHPVRRRRLSGRVLDSWPPSAAPYWGAGSLACALVALAVSWSLAVPWAVAALVVGCLLAVSLAVHRARRGGAYVPATMLGLAPVSIIIGFAGLYAVCMQGPNPGVEVSPGPAHMVDAFLLSFGVATTGGFLDLSPHSLSVRIAALVEMLLVVGVASGSAFIAAKEVWSRLNRSENIDQ